MTIGRMVKTAFCSDSSVERIWAAVVAKSATPWLPALWVLGSTIWLLMMLQPLMAFGFQIPFNDTKHKEKEAKNDELKCGVSFGVYRSFTLSTLIRQAAIDNKTLTRRDKTHFKTIFGMTTLYQSLIGLAEASRWAMVTLRHSSFYAAAMAERVVYPNPRSCVVSEVMKIVGRAITVILIENVALNNLQLSIMGVAKAADSNHKVDSLTLVSITLGIITTFYNIAMTTSTVYTFTRMVWGRIETPQLVAEEGEEWALENAELDKNNLLKLKVRARVASLVIAEALAAVFLVYALAKVFHAVTCHLGVWNVSGCVESVRP